MKKCVAAAALLFGLLASPSLAQTKTTLPGLGSGGQLEIQADKGMEWRQKEQEYLARGNVRLRRGDMTLRADEAGIRYNLEQAMAIERMFARGNVQGQTPRERIRAGLVVYRPKQGHLRLTGAPVQLQTATATAEAVESIDYWAEQRRAILQGKAKVSQDGKSLSADRIVVHLMPAATGKDQMALKRVEATGNVSIATAEETVTGQAGTYDATTGVARVKGNVVIRRGGHWLQGSQAEVNLNTGISTLVNTGTPEKPGDTRVRGVLRIDELRQEKAK